MRLSLFLGVLFLAGCATAPLDGAANDAGTQTIVTESTPDEAFAVALRVASQHGWQVQSSDATARVIRARTEGGVGVGEDVTIFVTDYGAGARISVRSRVTVGPIRRNVGQYLDRVSAVLGR
jgi:hypothetical protein